MHLSRLPGLPVPAPSISFLPGDHFQTLSGNVPAVRTPGDVTKLITRTIYEESDETHFQDLHADRDRLPVRYRECLSDLCRLRVLQHPRQGGVVQNTEDPRRHEDRARER
jgi:hypothetical protein